VSHPEGSFENKVVMRIFETKRKEVAGGGENRIMRNFIISIMRNSIIA
jgi:hypothetical protein